MLMADVMREAAGADAALLLHGTYYKGNSSKIYQGTIDIPDRFNLRSVSKDDALTTYEITGANLKKLMEHPLLNGEEVNALYAFSGLKAEYAPWRDEASNCLLYTSVEVLSHIVEFRNGESGMHVLNIRSITKMLLAQLCRISDQYSACLLYTSRCV